MYDEIQSDPDIEYILLFECLGNIEMALPRRLNVDGRVVPYFNGFHARNLITKFNWHGREHGLKEFEELLVLYRHWHESIMEDSRVDVLAY